MTPFTVPTLERGRKRWRALFTLLLIGVCAACGSSPATPIARGAAGGKMLFSTTAACHVCHMVTTDEKLVGPSLKGIASRAAERQPGLDANAYLHASILAPNEYIVPGYVAGIMPQSYRQQLTAEQVDDLVSYLLTLE